MYSSTWAVVSLVAWISPSFGPCECAPVLLSGEMYAEMTQLSFAEGNSGENGNDADR
jgi:hypothetical protein